MALLSFKNVSRFLAATVLGLAASLILLEAAARLGGYLAISSSDKRNKIFPEDSSRLRILAIGESTTTDFFAQTPLGAWPRQLETQLRGLGVDARVYNEGRSAVTTSLMAFRLPDYLEKYRPHMVIAMMGINDGPRVFFAGYPESWLARAAFSLQIVKVAEWVVDQVSRIGVCEIDYTEFDSTRFGHALEAGYQLAARGSPLAEVESEVRKIAGSEDPRDIALILSSLASRLSGDFKPGRDLTKVFVYANRAFDLFPHNFRVAMVLLRQLDDPKRGHEVSRKLLECGKNLPDELVGRMSNAASGLKEFTAILRSRNLQLHESFSFNTTRRNYQEMHRLLRDSGISLIAMQYPTLPLEKLKDYFHPDASPGDFTGSDITFVSNQENFESLLQRHKYEEVFTDRFKGNWGHTTDLGHEAIATAALKGVQSVLAKRQSLRIFAK